MSVNRILAETLVEAKADEAATGRNYIPLRELVRIVPDEGLKEITAGRNGEYIPVNFYHVKNVPQVMDGVHRAVDSDSRWDVSFGGSFFSNKKMMGELTVILLISVLLMYFILCAQFESFLQPLIVLAEIPMDIAFGLVLLWVTGHTLNLMSAIGIIVSCGIVVNDSILKLDSINEFAKPGHAAYGGHPYGRSPKAQGHRDDHTHYGVRHGAAALHLRPRFRNAAPALGSHDRHHDGGTCNQPICNTSYLLVNI